MRGFARVTLLGNLTRDPELKQVQATGSQLAQMGVAVNRRIKRGDEWTDYVDYFDIVVWGQLAVQCNEYLEKGRPIAVSGHLEHQRWESTDGSPRSRVVVVGEQVVFLGGPHKDSQDAASRAASAEPRPAEGEDDIPW